MTDGHTERLDSALDDKYRIERKLGEGGMASVYLAEDVKHKRKVALKILKPELAAVIGAERFLTEITTTANLQHPHILPLFDSGEADGFLYYVMPFIDGETLQERIEREQQLGVDEAVRIARDVADALDYAHRAGVIHRDIKPANILLHDGRPVVADFGIALAVSAAGGGRMTETGLSLGTPHYMSPEQASADRDLSARSDVYSLGCVLYEMLAGQPPHTGPSAQNILVRILTEDPRDVLELRRTVPANVAATVMKSIEKLPADRFDSAKQFIEALEDAAFTFAPTTRALTGPGTAAHMAAPVAAPTSRLLVRGLAGATVVLAGLAAWGWLRPPPPVILEPATLGLIDLDGIELDFDAKVTISPDGQHLAVFTTEEGGTKLWVRNVNDEHFRLLLHAGDPEDLVFSPQSDQIAFEDDGALMKLSLSGGAPRVVVPDQDGPGANQPHWGDDGTIVFIRGDSIYTVPENGGTPFAVLGGSMDSPHLLPDGAGLLMTESETFTTYFLAPDQDTAVTLIPGGVAARYVETGHILYVDEQGGLWALPFDLSAGSPTGDAVPVLQGINVRFGRLARYDVSRTGTLVYGRGGAVDFLARPSAELLVVGLDGDESVLPLPPRFIEHPRWAPDGERVAYSGTEAGRNGDPTMLYEYNVVVGSMPRRLTSEGTVNHRPAWSPDGTQIAFSSARDHPGRYIYVKNVLDNSPPQLITTGMALSGRSRPDHWLEDDLLVFTTGSSAALNNSWTMTVPDSTTAQPYLSAEGNRVWSRVAPQRDLAAYETDETGRREVFVQSFPTARQPTPVSSGGGVSPAWSPDGNTVYYWRETPGEDSLFAATVQRDPVFSVLSTEFVLAGDYGNGEDWDLHPDGDRFITTRRVLDVVDQTGASGAEEPERHLIVTNWFTELLAATGGGSGGGR